MIGRVLRGVLAGAVLVGAAPTSRSAYKGPVSDHFDGSRFFNPGKPFDKGLSDVWRFHRARKHGQWTRLREVQSSLPPAAVANGRLRVTFIGHATTLIQVDGQNLLTDPIWSEPASTPGAQRAGVRIPRAGFRRRLRCSPAARLPRMSAMTDLARQPTPLG